MSTAKLVDDFDRCAGEGRASLAAASEAQFGRQWQFFWGERLAVEATRYAMYHGVFFNHLIHHRAQLGVNLRLSGVPVPALYGPSADEI